MTIVEALKKFYEGNAYNEDDLKEADNVLDAIRAKYGPYEGANIAEYLQTAMANGVTPGSGGGGDYPVITFVDDQDMSCSWSYEKVLRYTSEGASLACIVEGEVEGEISSAGGTWRVFNGESIRLICAIVFDFSPLFLEYLPNGTLVPASDDAIGDDIVPPSGDDTISK